MLSTLKPLVLLDTDGRVGLETTQVVEKYRRSSRRVILLDYGSAYAPHSLVGNLMVDARRYGARGATPSRPDQVSVFRCDRRSEMKVLWCCRG